MRWVTATILVLVAMATVFILMSDIDVDSLFEALHEIGPVPFFAAISILPMLGFPFTPLLLLAGAAYGAAFSIPLIGLCYLVNLSLSFLVAGKLLRTVLVPWLANTRFKVPDKPPRNPVVFSLLVRLTPGPPAFLKSYLLGLAGIRFSTYMLISWPACFGYAIGVIVLGGAAAEGDWKQALIGAGLLVVFLVIVKLVKDRLERRRAAREMGPS